MKTQQKPLCYYDKNMLESAKKFWKLKSLKEITLDEWESLCDECGRCCLEKLEDEESGEILFTNVACQLYDCESFRCKSYEKRTYLVKDCRVLTPENVLTLSCLPETCAYRLLAEGKDLEWWHPLVSGNQETVNYAGISIADIVLPGGKVSPDDLENHIISLKKSKGKV